MRYAVMMNVTTYTSKSITHDPENRVTVAYIKCVFLEQVIFRERERKRKSERGRES